MNGIWNEGCCMRGDVVSGNLDALDQETQNYFRQDAGVGACADSTARRYSKMKEERKEVTNLLDWNKD